MVEASKFLFDKSCPDSPCFELIHPWTRNCSDATASMLSSCVKGSYKFYAMVYLVSPKTGLVKVKTAKLGFKIERVGDSKLRIRSVLQ